MDDLTKYRLDSANEKLISAKLLLDAGQYKDSIGRSYYAIFSAVRAVLASRQVDYSNCVAERCNGTISKSRGVAASDNRIYRKRIENSYVQQLFEISNSCFFLPKNTSDTVSQPN